MILTYDTTSIDIGYSQYPYTTNTEIVQVKERSASGVPHTEDYSVVMDTMKFSFVDMPTAEFVLLSDFYLNTVRGMTTEFTLQDDKENTYTVNFASSSLAFNETSHELWSGSFTVEVAQ